MSQALSKKTSSSDAQQSAKPQSRDGPNPRPTLDLDESQGQSFISNSLIKRKVYTVYDWTFMQCLGTDKQCTTVKPVYYSGRCINRSSPYKDHALRPPIVLSPYVLKRPLYGPLFSNRTCRCTCTCR